MERQLPRADALVAAAATALVAAHSETVQKAGNKAVEKTEDSGVVLRDAPMVEHDKSERDLTEAQKRELLDSLSPEDRDALWRQSRNNPPA